MFPGYTPVTGFLKKGEHIYAWLILAIKIF
jgi:hypothetical protein